MSFCMNGIAGETVVGLFGRKKKAGDHLPPANSASLQLLPQSNSTIPSYLAVHNRSVVGVFEDPLEARVGGQVVRPMGLTVAECLAPCFEADIFCVDFAKEGVNDGGWVFDKHLRVDFLEPDRQGKPRHFQALSSRINKTKNRGRAEMIYVTYKPRGQKKRTVPVQVGRDDVLVVMWARRISFSAETGWMRTPVVMRRSQSRKDVNSSLARFIADVFIVGAARWYMGQIVMVDIEKEFSIADLHAGLRSRVPGNIKVNEEIYEESSEVSSSGIPLDPERLRMHSHEWGGQESESQGFEDDDDSAVLIETTEEGDNPENAEHHGTDASSSEHEETSSEEDEPSGEEDDDGIRVVESADEEEESHTAVILGTPSDNRLFPLDEGEADDYMETRFSSMASMIVEKK